GFLVLIVQSRRGRPLAILGAAACVCGMWMSGSRTSLAAAGAALGLAMVAGMRQYRGRGLRRAIAAATTALIVGAALLFFGRAQPENPVRRLMTTLPSEVSRPAMSAFAREMWNRNGYGSAATALI